MTTGQPEIDNFLVGYHLFFLKIKCAACMNEKLLGFPAHNKESNKRPCIGLLPMVNVSVTMPDVALLVTEYWYTPGSLPVTVSVLR